MLSLPRLALATQVPRSLRPEPNLAPDVTIGWLLDALHSGRLSRPGPARPQRSRDVHAASGAAGARRGGGPACDPVPTRVDRRLRVGQSFVSAVTVAVQLRSEPVFLSRFRVYGTSSCNDALRYHSLRADVEPIGSGSFPSRGGAVSAGRLTVGLGAQAISPRPVWKPTGSRPYRSRNSSGGALSSQSKRCTSSWPRERAERGARRRGGAVRCDRPSRRRRAARTRVHSRPRSRSRPIRRWPSSRARSRRPSPRSHTAPNPSTMLEQTNTRLAL